MNKQIGKKTTKWMMKIKKKKTPGVPGCALEHRPHCRAVQWQRDPEELVLPQIPSCTLESEALTANPDVQGPFPQQNPPHTTHHSQNIPNAGPKEEQTPPGAEGTELTWGFGEAGPAGAELQGGVDGGPSPSLSLPSPSPSCPTSLNFNKTRLFPLIIFKELFFI